MPELFQVLKHLQPQLWLWSQGGPAGSERRPSVRSDTFDRLGVGVGSTPSTLKQVEDAWTHDDFSTLHHSLHVTQSSALCRRQRGRVGIVWFHVGLLPTHSTKGSASST